jgi:hypothetical protein
METTEQTGPQQQPIDYTADESTQLPPASPHVVFDEETFTPPPPDADSVINTGAADLEPTEKKKPKKEKPQPKAPAKKSRETKTVSLKTIADAGVTQSEYDYHNAIFQARLESGLTKDWNHYIRQCMDFAANYDVMKNKFSTLSFARPDAEPLLLKDGYFATAAPHLVTPKNK